MAVNSHRPNWADPDGDPARHTYRISQDQYWRIVESGIIPEADGVELRDGFLCRRSASDRGQPESHYRLDVDQYRAMASHHILTTEDRAELLEGWLIARLSKSPPHMVSKGLTYDALRILLPPGWFTMVASPMTTLDSEPEPDLSIVRGKIRDYVEKAPGPGQIPVVVEVADVSLPRDRSIKKRIYARSGFSTYWLINLVDMRIEIYTDPTGPIDEPEYRDRRDLGRDDHIPLVIEGREIGRIAARDVLP